MSLRQVLKRSLAGSDGPSGAVAPARDAQPAKKARTTAAPRAKGKAATAAASRVKAKQAEMLEALPTMELQVRGKGAWALSHLLALGGRAYEHSGRA